MDTNKQDEPHSCVELPPPPQQNQGAVITRYALVTNPGQPRIPGLHRGVMRISADFNDPLPDDFWFGAST